MKAPFYSRYAWLCLALVAGVCPVAMYGARQAVQSMKNDVRNWLPDSFRETTELEWFRERFIDEQFVVVSWEGCEGGPKDERFRKFIDLVQGETPPSTADAHTSESTTSTSADAPEDVPFGIQVAAKFGLYGGAEDFLNWGGQQEKWLRGRGDSWYYLLPDGDLYRWRAINGPGPAAWRAVLRFLWGPQVSGVKVAELGPVDGPWYYARVQRLTAPLFKSVISGPDVLRQLTSEQGGLAGDHDEALRRLQGTLFGPDGKQTALIVTLTETAQRDLHRVVGRGLLGKPRGRVLEIADEVGIREASLHLGGPPVDNVAIDEEGSVTLVRLIGLCIGMGLLMAYLCLRSIPLMFMVFVVGGISALISMALVHWTGGNVDAVLMSMPALVYVLALSGAIHVVNYYRDAIADGYDVRTAPTHAAKHGWLPCTLCAVTTALGMVSLCTSEIQPIRNFGIYSGAGVIVALVVLLVYLPAALQVFPPKIRPQDLEAGLGMISLPASAWTWYAHAIVRHRRVMFAAISLTLVWLTFGASKINTSVEILKMFDQRAKIIQDYVWLEKHLGKLVPMELVIKIPHAAVRPDTEQLSAMTAAERQATATQLPLLDRLEFVSAVERAVERQFGESGQAIVGRTLSAATFAPVLPAATGELRNYAHRTALNAGLEGRRQQLLETDYLRIDPDDAAELWRISLRLGALQEVDYGLFVHQLRGEVEPVIAAFNVRQELLNRLLAARGEAGFAGARIGLVQIVSDEADAKATAIPGDAMNVGEIIANKTNIEAQRLHFSNSQQRTQLTTLAESLRAARLRVDEARIAPEQFGDEFIGLLANFDAVIISGHEAVAEALGKVEHPLLLKAPDSVESWEEHADASENTKIAAVYTGIVPLVYKAQRTLLENLIESSVWSGFLVSGCMIVLLVPGNTLRERLYLGNLFHGTMAGLISMLPNVFPLIVVFGAIGWMGIRVDIGSMMTASVALGIAVDDTIHYLTWFRWALGQNQSRRDAILTAYLRSGNSMLHTTIIGGMGMFVFAASTFTPTQRFGYLMLTILAAAVLGDLLWGPTLYAGFLGRFFHPAHAPDAQVQLSTDKSPGHKDSAKTLKMVGEGDRKLRRDGPVKQSVKARRKSRQRR